MRIVGEMWCVVTRDSDGDVCTVLFADRDSASEWIDNDMAEIIDNYEDEEIDKFLAMDRVEKLDYVRDVFGNNYEIELRDIYARETAATQLALAVETASDEEEKP
jgi:hypothetical protein